MAIQMSEGFSLLSKQPLDERFVYDSIAAMAAMEDYMLYDGVTATIKDDSEKKTYQWWSSNEVDATLGKWRVLNSGGGEVIIPIETISVNGEEVTPDEDKNVDVDIPIMTIQVNEETVEPDENRVVNIDLSDYSVKTETGNSIDIEMDETTYVMTITLKDPDGTALSTKTVDLPLETMIIDGSYADGVLTLTLNATDPDTGEAKVIEVDISDIIDGLVSDSFTIAGLPLKNDDNAITKEDLLEALDIAEGGGSLPEDLTSTIEVGGIKANTTFDEGTSLVDILKALLVKDIAPSMSLTISPQNGGLCKQGDTVDVTTFTVTVDPTTCVKINSLEFYKNGSIKIGSIDSVDLDIGTTTYTFNYDSSISNTATFSAKMTLTQLSGEIVTIDASKAFRFVDPSFTGVLSSPDDITADNIAALSEALKGSKDNTARYSTENQIMVYAYPASYGDLSSIIDIDTGYKLTWAKTTVNLDDGVLPYNVYYSDACKVTNYNVKFS